MKGSTKHILFTWQFLTLSIFCSFVSFYTIFHSQKKGMENKVHLVIDAKILHFQKTLLSVIVLIPLNLQSVIYVGYHKSTKFLDT